MKSRIELTSNNHWNKIFSSALLKDWAEDSIYVFEVKSYDKYRNLCKTNSLNDSSSCYRKFTIPVSGVGVYTITISINSASNRQYLPNDSIFIIYAREINLSKVIGKKRETTNKVGEKAEIDILAFGKKGNNFFSRKLQR